MTWDDLIGQATAIRILKTAASKPAPGYILAGPTGIGKASLAELFAREVLNLSPEQSLESHPDFIRLAKVPGDQSIKVDAVRDLLEAIHRTTALGGKRIVLIEQAEALNESSVNVLLKDIEESRHTVYVFIVERLERLPITLRSRLVTIQLEQVPRMELVAWLQGRGFTAEQSESLVTWSRGCPGQALAIAASLPAWQSEEQQAREFVDKMLSGTLGEQLVLIERLARSYDRAEDPAKAWQRFIALAGQVLQPILQTHPKEASKFARGLAFAHKSIGTSLPMRVVLEWIASEPYNRTDYLPSMLTTSYL